MIPLKAGAHIHMMGICGTAMASLAGILKNMGYQITGSDQNVYPPMSTQLEQLGIKIQIGYKKENLSPRPDLVIVGNVITRNHEEAQALLQSDIPYTSLPKMLGEVAIANRDSLVIAGTHGKTTTTAMTTWVADQLGLKPGFLIGGIPINYGMSFREPKGNTFVIEGDEYDTAFFDKVPKFNHYKPKFVILTSVEFDHADIYADLKAVKKAFEGLLERIPEDGVLVYAAQDKNISDILEAASCKKIQSYGIQKGDYSAQNLQWSPQGAVFDLTHKGQVLLRARVPVFGEYNVANSVAVFALANEMKWNLQSVAQAFESFKGVKRRQEILATPRGVTVIDDFAHHPTAVKVTLKGVQERFKGHKVIAVFEARSATSRRKIFQKEYVDAFSLAERVIFPNVFNLSALKEEDRFSIDMLVEDLKKKGVHAEHLPTADDIVELLAREARPGDVILIMSNGGFDGIHQKLIKKLSSVDVA